METRLPTSESLPAPPLSLLDSRPPRPSFWHLFAWLAFFGSFVLISFAPLFPPLSDGDYVVPPGILDDPSMLVLAIASSWISFGIAAFLAWRAGLSLGDLGLVRRPWRETAVWTLVILSLLLATVVLAELLFGDKLHVVEPLTRRPSGFSHWMLWLGLSVSAGFCEEFFMRGYGIGLLRRFGVPKEIGLILTAAIFGSLHIYEGPFAILVIGVWGLLFGYVFVRTGSLWPAILAHFLVDAVAPFFVPV